MPIALIVGAGIAGPVAAVALRRLGYDVEIAEARAEEADDAGAWLTVQSNGLAALDAVGLLEAVRPLGFATPVIELRSGSGRVLGSVPLGAPLPDGTPSLSMERAALHRVLRDGARAAGVRVTYGRRLVGAREDDDGVDARFADGSTARADLLVGCDGVRSTVRSLLSPANPPPRYLPLLNLGGYAPGSDLDIAPERLHMVFGRRASFGYGKAPSGDVWWFANPPRAAEPGPGELPSVSSAAWREELLRLVAGDASPAARIVAATQGELRAWATYDLPPVPVWHSRRLVLVGDAAHAMSPSSGQGASTSIEDAVTLATCLRDLSPLPAALAAYERLRRPRVEQIAAAARRTSSTKVAGPVGRRVRDALLPLGLRLANRDGAGGLAWVYRDPVTWDDPVRAAGRAASPVR